MKKIQFFLLSLVLGGIILISFRKDIATSIASTSLRNATTAEAEFAAAKLILKLSHDLQLLHAYSVETFDEHDVSITPWINGEYDSAKQVRVEWENGMSVTRPLLHKDSLEYIMGE